MPESLCENCVHLREVVSPKGSRFLLCLLSGSERRFPKYPPQPVLRCLGHERKEEGDEPNDDTSLPG
jgi:hypothetical protein